MTKSKAAFLFASQTLGKQRLYLWSFTFKELLAVKGTRKRWNHLLTLLLREWPSLQGLRVFELHQEHGLHVHLVTNQFIDVNRARELATQAGWGRIHVTPMPSEHSGYLAKYLSKEGRTFETRGSRRCGCACAIQGLGATKTAEYEL